MVKLSRRRAALRLLLLLALLALTGPAPGPAAEGPSAKAKALAAELLQRSTERFLAGDLEAGRKDLAKSLELDPDQRQAWLNRAGLDISEERYDDALQALAQARRLDPAAPDNELNEGAVRLLQGRVKDAGESFTRYLASTGETPEALYLVATNYAGGGYAGLAADLLRRAVAQDERVRLRVRQDPNFSKLLTQGDFVSLLATDNYRPPPGSASASRTFSAPYRGGQGPLLPAVLDALRATGERFDTTVETTAQWALVWGAFRIRIHDRLPATAGGEPQGEVSLSAPANILSVAEWQQRTQRLFEAVTVALVKRQRAAELPAPPQPPQTPPRH